MNKEVYVVSRAFENYSSRGGGGDLKFLKDMDLVKPGLRKRVSLLPLPPPPINSQKKITHKQTKKTKQLKDLTLRRSGSDNIHCAFI